MDEMELQAIETIQDGLRLIAQVLTYRKHGEYQFQALCPEEYAKWVRDSRVLQSSANQKASNLGHWAWKLTDEMAASDRICVKYGQGSRKARHQAARLDKAAAKLTEAYHTVINEVIR